MLPLPLYGATPSSSSATRSQPYPTRDAKKGQAPPFGGKGKGNKQQGGKQGQPQGKTWFPMDVPFAMGTTTTVPFA